MARKKGKASAAKGSRRTNTQPDKPAKKRSIYLGTADPPTKKPRQLVLAVVLWLLCISGLVFLISAN